MKTVVFFKISVFLYYRQRFNRNKFVKIDVQGTSFGFPCYLLYRSNYDFVPGASKSDFRDHRIGGLKKMW